MSLGGFILTPVRTIAYQLLQRDLESKKPLDANNFDPYLFKSILFLTQLFTTFNFSFSRGSADLRINQHDKDKVVVGNMNGSIKICKK